MNTFIKIEGNRDRIKLTYNDSVTKGIITYDNEREYYDKENSEWKKENETYFVKKLEDKVLSVVADEEYDNIPLEDRYKLIDTWDSIKNYVKRWDMFSSEDTINKKISNFL